MTIIHIENVNKSYDGKRRVIKDLNLEIQEGEFVTMIGASGCGKTTLLKMINGLIKPDSGKILIKDTELSEVNLIELRRQIGYVIQQIGLFPHMTIQRNIAYVLELMKVDDEVKASKAKELIELVGLDVSYLDKYPRALSGGEKQRVGVARALAANPDIILMDEPFGAVDEITRKVLQDEILNIQKRLNKTILFVTHDIEEAIKLGSRIILFNNGCIEQMGTREEMVFAPKTKYVETFFGVKNFMAYMNVTAIQKILKPMVHDVSRGDQDRLGVSLATDATLMEGVRMMFDHQLESVPVTDENGQIVGEFSVNSLIGPG